MESGDNCYCGRVNTKLLKLLFYLYNRLLCNAVNLTNIVQAQ